MAILAAHNYFSMIVLLQNATPIRNGTNCNRHYFVLHLLLLAGTSYLIGEGHCGRLKYFRSLVYLTFCDIDWRSVANVVREHLAPTQVFERKSPLHPRSLMTVNLKAAEWLHYLLQRVGSKVLATFSTLQVKFTWAFSSNIYVTGSAPDLKVFPHKSIGYQAIWRGSFGFRVGIRFYGLIGHASTDEWFAVYLR